MTFWNAETTERKMEPPTSMLMRDVGFFDAASLQRQNTAEFGGLNSEFHLENEAIEPVWSWLNDNLSKEEFENLAFETGEIMDQQTRNERVWTEFETRRAAGAIVPPELTGVSRDDLVRGVMENASLRLQQREKQLRRTSTAGQVGAFVGEVAGSLEHIENVATLPLGAPARAGIIATGLAEGVINAGIEATTFDQRQQLRQRLGVDPDGEFWQTVGAGFVFGSVLGGGVRGLTGPEIRAAGRHVFQRLGRRQTAELASELASSPIVRSMADRALADIGNEEAIGAFTPAARREHEAGIARAEFAISRGEPMQTAPFDAPDIAVGKNLRANFKALDPDDFDPETFQQIDEATARLEEVEADIREIRRTPPPPEVRQLEREIDRQSKAPVVRMVKSVGGVEPTGRFAQELRAMGVTPQRFPGLFRRGGATDLDNVVASEHIEVAEFLQVDESTGYFSPQDIADAIAEEASGQPRKTEAQRAAIQALDDFERAADFEAAPVDPVAPEIARVPDRAADPRTDEARRADIAAHVDEFLASIGARNALTDEEYGRIIDGLHERGGDVENAVDWHLSQERDYARAADPDDWEPIPFLDDAPASDRGGSGSGVPRSPFDEGAEAPGGPGARSSDEGGARAETAQPLTRTVPTKPANLGSTRYKEQTALLEREVLTPEALESGVIVVRAVEGERGVEVETRPLSEVMEEIDADDEFADQLGLCLR